MCFTDAFKVVVEGDAHEWLQWNIKQHSSMFTLKSFFSNFISFFLFGCCPSSPKINHISMINNIMHFRKITQWFLQKLKCFNFNTFVSFLFFYIWLDFNCPSFEIHSESGINLLLRLKIKLLRVNVCLVFSKYFIFCSM